MVIFKGIQALGIYTKVIPLAVVIDMKQLVCTLLKTNKSCDRLASPPLLNPSWLSTHSTTLAAN